MVRHEYDISADVDGGLHESPLGPRLNVAGQQDRIRPGGDPDDTRGVITLCGVLNIGIQNVEADLTCDP